MRVFKLSLLSFISALFLTACGSTSQNEQAVIAPDDQMRAAQEAVQYDYENRPAKENLDLQAIGELLENAETAEEFEYRLNSPENGVNNLDLNGDGYADYIGVREFDERDTEERGFSLFSMFGPETIQEIATIIFDRNRNNDNEYYPGSRVLITGNEQIYGDNYYYESNWLERSVPIVSWLFTERDNNYNSPYYYENYPEYYEPYSVVETPVYRTRIEQYYNTPVFVQTAQPSLRDIKIKSPYRGKSMDKIYSKMAKPTKQQIDFRKNNPGPPEFVRQRNEKTKNSDFKPEKPFRDKPNKFEKQEKVRTENPQMREKPNKPEQRVKAERQQPVRIERPNQQKVERQQPNFERQKPAKAERQQQMKPQKQENRGGGGGNNKGGGGNGKGNGGGGGGGKKGKG